MTILGRMRRGFQASVTLDNINLSQALETGNQTRTGWGLIELVNAKKATYEYMYRNQPWVAISVNKLSRGIARLPLKGYVAGDNPGQRERVRQGPLAELLRRPYEGGSPFSLKSALVGNLAIYGNCILVKRRPKEGLAPLELIPSSFAHWEVQPGPGAVSKGQGRAIDGYTFTSSQGQRIPFLPDEVMHFKWWGPGNDLIGAPPLEPLRRTLVIEDAAQRVQIASYEHGARPSGAWSTDEKLTEEQTNMLRDKLTAVYGGVDNAFKMAVLSHGVKWAPMSHTLVDAEVINTRKLTREEVVAVYDLPQPNVGILDRATFSNVTEQGVQLYRDSYGPPTTMIEETFQTQLIDMEIEMEGQYVEFDLNEVLKGDIEKRYNAYQKAQWFMTPNEVREKENLPPIDDATANSINLPLNTQPVGPIGEARCPDCSKLLARNVVAAELWCDRCAKTVTI